MVEIGSLLCQISQKAGQKQAITGCMRKYAVEDTATFDLSGMWCTWARQLRQPTQGTSFLTSKKNEVPLSWLTKQVGNMHGMHNGNNMVLHVQGDRGVPVWHQSDMQGYLVVFTRLFKSLLSATLHLRVTSTFKTFKRL